jgi:magnesium transporter
MMKTLVFDPESGFAKEGRPEDAVKDIKAGRTVWLDIKAPAAADLEFIAASFNIKPLIIEEMQSERLPAKLISGAHNTFISWSSFSNGGSGSTARIFFLLSQGLIITVHQESAAAIIKTRQTVLSEPDKMSRGPGEILYLILDAAVDDYFIFVDNLSDTIDALEDIMFGKPKTADVKRLFELKKEMLRIRRIAAPEREVVNSLLRRLPAYINSDLQTYFSDLYDHLVRIIDLIDTLRDVTGGAMQIYQATISNNLNAIMKQLTIIATIMMPLTLISGIFGMNVNFPGKDTALMFAVVMGSMTVIGIAMIVWFWRRDWL